MSEQAPTAYEAWSAARNRLDKARRIFATAGAELAILRSRLWSAENTERTAQNVALAAFEEEKLRYAEFVIEQAANRVQILDSIAAELGDPS